MGQSDVALTILDYLGLGPPSDFVGRSILRRYVSPRVVAFSNTYLGLTGQISGTGISLYCDEALADCDRQRSAVPGLFGAVREPEPISQEEIDGLRDIVAYSLRETLAPTPVQKLEMTGIPRTPITGIANQRIIDGQGLYVPAQSRIEVNLAVRLEGRGR